MFNSTRRQNVAPYVPGVAVGSSAFPLRSHFASAFDASLGLLYVFGGCAPHADCARQAAESDGVGVGAGALIGRDLVDASLWVLHVASASWRCIHVAGGGNGRGGDDDASPRVGKQEAEHEEEEEALAPTPVYGATMTLVGRKLYIYGCVLIVAPFIIHIFAYCFSFDSDFSLLLGYSFAFVVCVSRHRSHTADSTTTTS